MNVMIYHNPRCTKSRLSLDLLKSKNIEPLVVEYLNTPPTRSEIKHLLRMLGMTARELIRKNEDRYKELGLDNPDLTEEQLVVAMSKNPILIERPIVVKGERAAIGRPPENILAILD